MSNRSTTTSIIQSSNELKLEEIQNKTSFDEIFGDPFGFFKVGDISWDEVNPREGCCSGQVVLLMSRPSNISVNHAGVCMDTSRAMPPILLPWRFFSLVFLGSNTVNYLLYCCLLLS